MTHLKVIVLSSLTLDKTLSIQEGESICWLNDIIHAHFNPTPVPECYQFTPSPSEITASSKAGTLVIANLLRPDRQTGWWNERRVCVRVSAQGVDGFRGKILRIRHLCTKLRWMASFYWLFIVFSFNRRHSSLSNTSQAITARSEDSSNYAAKCSPDLPWRWGQHRRRQASTTTHVVAIKKKHTNSHRSGNWNYNFFYQANGAISKQPCYKDGRKKNSVLKNYYIRKSLQKFAQTQHDFTFCWPCIM